VTGQNKGGFDVQVIGQRAFCPASQIDLRRRDPAEYIGQRLRFRVTRSRAADATSWSRVASCSRPNQPFWRRAPGNVCRWGHRAGTVTSLRDFGRSSISAGWRSHPRERARLHRSAHPSDLLKVGATVEASREDEPDPRPARSGSAFRSAPSRPDPWTTVLERFPIGATVRGKVRKLESFGAFVELARGRRSGARVAHGCRPCVSHAKQLPRRRRVEVTVLSIEPSSAYRALDGRSAKHERDASEQADRQSTRPPSPDNEPAASAPSRSPATLDQAQAKERGRRSSCRARAHGQALFARRRHRAPRRVAPRSTQQRTVPDIQAALEGHVESPTAVLAFA